LTYDFLLPDANLSLETILRQEQTVQLVMTTISKGASCPDCGQVSYRVHSHATRSPADLPLSSLPTQVLLKVCRFFCDAPNCQRKTFTQQAPALLLAYSFRTSRLFAAQRSIGLTAGGEAGAQLTSKL
jgi:transposase